MLLNLVKNNPPYYVGIRGTGYYLPERVVKNEELMQYVDTTDEWIQQKIGIQERRIAAENEATSDLAYKAALMAIENAGITAQDIDLIILNCLCPDHRDPATAHLVQAKLGAFKAAAFDVNAGGCPGNMYSVSIGANFVANGSCKNVLVIGGDVLTSIIDFRDRLMSCFFGDGAGAMVLSRASKPGIMGYSLYADGRGYETIYIPHGGSRARVDNVSVDPGMKDSSSYLHMDGKAVFNFATNVMPDSIKELANEVGMNLYDLDIVIPHQANINIIKESMKKLGMPLEKAFVNLHKYGNMHSASVFIAVAEAVREGRIPAESKVALTAFGSGLGWGAILLQWNKRADFID